jgi:hypothetical protein
MPYVIDIEGAPNGTTATLDYIVFGRKSDAEGFCRLGNLRERHRSSLRFTYRKVSPTADGQPPAPSRASGHRP